MRPFNKKPFNRDSKPDWKKSGDRPTMMHTATCGECGNECQVPFKPNGRKPVLCNDCFKPEDRPARKSFGDRPSYGDRPSRGDRPSYGERSSYGDRPSFGDRPSYRAPSVPGSYEMREINAKLDRLLALLEKQVGSSQTSDDTNAEEPAPRKKAWAKIKYD